ncbi:sugar-transfer associated ATP-grasp domain-containing protein [Halalkalibacillus halophilus]|uniref:sugar-transfer associated ATP-grasp domain-containing protein n=1 Tax=Halalkalibacillus halophilus TaxID=392827 RepID=UPI0004140710|nr:sugar-transfer associated ATP-grasp domain-containing protein [Halalkalibacillus halophilus]
MEHNYNELGFKTKQGRFKRYKEAGLLESLDYVFINEVKSFWKDHLSFDVEPSLPVAFYNLTNKRDPWVVPHDVMRKKIIPYLNDMNMVSAYSDKNLYNNLIEKDKTPSPIIKNINGRFFNSSDSPLIKEEAANLLLKEDAEYIIKPSQTDDGEGIEKLTIKNGILYLNEKDYTINDIDRIYNKNYIIQELISQHPVLAEPHPNSVNTLRIVTLRWDGIIHHLLTFARFGTNNNVKDNAGGGGVCIGVNDDGSFYEFALDKNAKVYYKHPSTDFSFSDLKQIPNYDKCISFAKSLHKRILHHDFISWDITIDKEGEPVFIESNFFGATWLYQLTTQKPLFGNLTIDILKRINAINTIGPTEIPQRTIKRQSSEIDELKNSIESYKNQTRKLKKKNKKLTNKNAGIMNELNSVKLQNEYLRSSISWRLTSPLRVLKKIIKRNH